MCNTRPDLPYTTGQLKAVFGDFGEAPYSERAAMCRQVEEKLRTASRKEQRGIKRALTTALKAA